MPASRSNARTTTNTRHRSRTEVSKPWLWLNVERSAQSSGRSTFMQPRMDAVLSRQQLDRVCVVLVRARKPNNIGAVARAMHDLRCHHRRYVSDDCGPL